ncbi:hypothetical protein Nepgr_024650 [Nepenthes gracilis]|uniref:Uncharacterized protein n=1 Tax=Nepenthes gracilis TaxID=150966 RepID=A0AAD3T4Y8_NEPGR|nr:hypothetical protein Nepgr_024650 [Nepenthes gracilis]
MDDFSLKFSVNGLTGHNGMAQVGFKLMEWPTFGSNFPVNGLTGFGGMWSSWQHEKRENFDQRVDRLCGMDGMDGFSGQRVDRTLWHGPGWAPADGRDDFWLKFSINDLTGHSGMT